MIQLNRKKEMSLIWVQESRWHQDRYQNMDEDSTNALFLCARFKVKCLFYIYTRNSEIATPFTGSIPWHRLNTAWTWLFVFYYFVSMR